MNKNVQLSVLIILFVPIIGLTQNDIRGDTASAVFYHQLRTAISNGVNNSVIDTTNIMGVYMFKFGISAEKKIDFFWASRGTPTNLKLYIKSLIDSLIDTIQNQKKLNGIANKTYVLPLIIDYYVSTRKKTSNTITIKNVLDMMAFEELKEKSSHSFEVPISCVLFPIFFYQSPHIRAIPKSWLKNN